MSATNRILKLLEGLSATPTGQKVYHHIQRNLQQQERAWHDTEQAYLDLANVLLDALIRYLAPTSSESIELQLIRHELASGISSNELQQLAEQVKSLIDPDQTSTHRDDFLKQAMAPLMLAGNNQEALTSIESPQDIETNHNTPKTSAKTTNNCECPPQIDLLYQNQLDRTRDAMQAIQNQLGEEIVAAMQINDELAALLKDARQTLASQGAQDEATKRMQESYLRQCQNLMDKHHTLVTQLDKTYNKLHLIEATGQQLNEELSNLHRLSLTDDLTELPNRRALLRRLEDETARSRRYDTPLALAIIDLDKFKPINDQYGHAAGDTVLQQFASKLVSVFRHHDTTARFGGEEFAVLMPNTDIDGAFKALEKMRHLVKESCCTLDNGEQIPMPTFSAGITLYNPDESIDELINRADTAMYRAKQMGRARIEVHSAATAHHSPTPIKKPALRDGPVTATAVD